MDAFRIQTSEELKFGKINLHVAFKVYIEKIRGGIKYRRENAETFGYISVMNKALGVNESFK